MSGLLITRPNHDSGTNYLYYWSKLVIEESLRKNVAVFDLAKSRVNRDNFVSYVKKHVPKLVFINGHGSDDAVCGFNNEVLIDTKKYRLDLIGSVVVARSCRCGKVLGKVLVKNGARAFVGYKDDFVIKTTNRFSTRPLFDPVAKMFLEPSNYIVMAMIKGHTVSESDGISKRMLLKNLLNLLVTDKDDKNDIGRWLWHDYENQAVIGDGGARL